MLRRLTEFRDCATKRVSSWDRSGGNMDFIKIPKGEKVIIANLRDPGCVTHIWMTVGYADRLFLRRTLIRIYWDGEKNPSVDAPLGDFFGVGHNLVNRFQSMPLIQTGTSLDIKGKLRSALNCYFPMPFSESARVEIVNECHCEIPRLYYHIDYEHYNKPLKENTLMFHAKWRRENPCDGVDLSGIDTFGPEDQGKKHPSGEGNYVILEAEGKGNYVGCVLNVDNIVVGEKAPVFSKETAELLGRERMEWWGEGDDMIFIDGESWPPSIHGTGTEDYFCNAWGMQDEAFLYFGTSIPEHDSAVPGRRKSSSYRFHIEDPIVFHKSIKVTIEHGHANTRSNDYSSVAYWYQNESHKPWAPMPPVEERLPRMPEEFWEAYKKEEEVYRIMGNNLVSVKVKILRRDVNTLMDNCDYKKASMVLEDILKLLKRHA